MSDDLVKSHIEWLRGDHEGCNPFLADRIETLVAERDALREALKKAEAALADIAEGEPDPNDLAEKIWCKDRAAAAQEDYERRILDALY